uniref:Uncharacterized protein n=1 Tax=Romanomermis culicivorax TaxID=13658 RepID=A0A915KV26_ROMCU
MSQFDPTALETTINSSLRKVLAPLDQRAKDHLPLIAKCHDPKSICSAQTTRLNVCRIRALLQRQDVTADFTGQILTVWSCKKNPNYNSSSDSSK